MKMLIKYIIGALIFFNACTPLKANEINLTQKEKAWLKAHQVIRIAPDPEFPPIEYFDNNEKYIGIAADYMLLIEKRLGVEFEVVKCDDWNQVIEKAKSREIDLLPAVSQTPQKSVYMLVSDSYLNFKGVIITQINSDYDNLFQLKDKKVAVVKNYVWYDLLQKNSDNLKIVSVKNVSQGLKHVATGKVDAMIATLPIALYYIKNEGILNLHVSGEVEYYTQLSVLTRKDWPQLNSIINKVLASITKQERAEIYNKWISVEPQSFYRKHEIYNILLIVVIQLFFISFLFLLWKRFRKLDAGSDKQFPVKYGKLYFSFLLFLLLDLLVILDEVIDLPYLLFNAPKTPINYHELYFESAIIFIGGIIIYYFLYKNLKQRKISENSLIESEKRYRQLFENSPVALWEEDFSELYEYFSELEQKGVGDLRDYLEKNPDEIHVCAQKVNVLDVNKATLVMNDAKTKKELLGDIDKTFTEQSINVFKEGVLAVSEGKNYFRSEAHIKTLSGGLKYVDIIYYIEQICNTKIFVSMTDITDKKKAEKELEKYQQYLEKMVDERTKELEEKNRELKQFNKLFVDREFRIHELKERVKQLEKGE